MSLITLTTDFGTRDWFVGTMKGVIHQIAPNTPITDLTHGIPRGDIHAGAFALAAAHRYFPKGTIHVGVVDPNVGGGRDSLVIQTSNGYFIGPDNGLFSYVLRGESVKSMHRIQNSRYQLPVTSQTFHGRDVFAPVAAHLSRGVPLSQFGPRAHEMHQLNWPDLKAQKTGLRGEVVYVDRFGNAITNITGNALLSSGADKVRAAQKLIPIKNSYDSVPAKSAVAVLGSSGLMEIAINGGDASKTLKLKIGSAVSLPAAK